MSDENKSFDERLQEEKKKFFEMHTKEVARILGILKDHFGSEVFEVISKEEGKKVVRRWSEKAKEHGSNTIEDLIQLLWEPMREHGLEYTMEKKDNGILMHCTKCPYYDHAQKHGTTETSFAFTCATDPYIVEGFNDKIGFKRTKTLMEGHDCCDHFYYMKE